MRNFFENGFSWFKKSSAKPQTAESADGVAHVEAAEEAKVELAIHQLQAVVDTMTEANVASAQADVEAAVDFRTTEATSEKVEVVANVSFETAAEPILTSETVETTEPVLAPVVNTPVVETPAREPGPLVKIMVRGARLYATCPHCEAMWSVRERLTDPHRNQFQPKAELNCPACEKLVSLPETALKN